MVDDSKETVFSTHNRADTHERTEDVTHTQDLHKFNPDKNPTPSRISRHKVLPVTKRLFATDSLWKREKTFSSKE